MFAPEAAHILAEPPASNVIKVSTSLPKPVACEENPFRKETSVSPGKKLSRTSASVSAINDCESRTFQPPIGEGYDPFSAIMRHILILVHLLANLRTYHLSYLLLLLHHLALIYLLMLHCIRFFVR